MTLGFFSRHGVALLAAFVVFTGPAYANGVNTNISYGDTKTGRITTNGHDDYKFTATEGATFVASLAETGTHDSRFKPSLTLIPPGQQAGPMLAQALHVKLHQANAAAGEWTIRIARLDDSQSSGGNYAVKLVRINGQGGTPMTLGRSYTGSNERGEPALYTFTGAENQKVRLAVGATAGQGFLPLATMFSPSGAETGWIYCRSNGGCSTDLTLPASGAYTVVMGREDTKNVEGGYTVSVSNHQ